MRILHVAPSLAPDEPARTGALDLAALGHDVELIGEDGGAASTRTETSHGLLVRRFPTRRRHEVALGEMRDHLRRTWPHVDVVHAHGLRTVPLIDAVPPAKVVVTPRSGDLSPTRIATLLRLLQPRRRADVLLRAARLVAGSAGELEVLVEHLGADPGRVAVVPEPIDAEAVLRALPHRTDRPLAVVAGRLERGMRIERAIAALGALPRFGLVVVGRGPARRALRRFAEDLAVAERVRFVEPPDDLERRRWLRSADVAVSLAERQTTIMPLLEALALGTPIVASRTLAHVELTHYADRGSLELVSPRSSPLAIADAIEAMAGAERRPVPAADLPTPRAAIDRLVDVYREVAGGDRAAGSGVAAPPRLVARAAR